MADTVSAGMGMSTTSHGRKPSRMPLLWWRTGWLMQPFMMSPLLRSYPPPLSSPSPRPPTQNMNLRILVETMRTPDFILHTIPSSPREKKNVPRPVPGSLAWPGIRIRKNIFCVDSSDPPLSLDLAILEDSGQGRRCLMRDRHGGPWVSRHHMPQNTPSERKE